MIKRAEARRDGEKSDFVSQQTLCNLVSFQVRLSSAVPEFENK